MKTIKVKGMVSQHSELTVLTELNKLGAKNIKANHSKGEVTFDEVTPIDMDLLGERLKKKGLELE